MAGNGRKARTWRAWAAMLTKGDGFARRRPNYRNYGAPPLPIHLTRGAAMDAVLLSKEPRELVRVQITEVRKRAGKAKR